MRRLRPHRGARMLAPIAPLSPIGDGGASGPGTRVENAPFAPGMRCGRIAGPAMLSFAPMRGRLEARPC